MVTRCPELINLAKQIKNLRRTRLLLPRLLSAKVSVGPT